MIELLTVVGIIGILAALIVPAVGKAKTSSLSSHCLSNLSQLQKAWQMYTDDNDDHVPSNRAEKTFAGWRSSLDSWAGASNAKRDLSAQNIENSVFVKGGYIRSVAIFRCPDDRSKAMTRTGPSGLPRTRSYSMNGNLGGRTNEVQNTIVSARAIKEPIRLFCFIDEDKESIDDGHFLVWPFPDERWVNLPAGRHGNTGNLSFADGHVEHWRWRAAKMFSPRESYWKLAKGADLIDLQSLQRRILDTSAFPPQP